MNLENEIKAAADWWVGQLKRTAVFDSGDGELSARMNMFAPAVQPLSDQQVETFRQALMGGMGLEIDQNRLERGLFYAVHVDYDPDKVLCNAADEAEFNLRHRLPIKTTLKIYAGRVEAKIGYGRPFEVVYRVQP